ncbi:hypothetical protein, partial [Bacteroides stercoris]
MKSMILALLVAMLGFNGYAQTKTGTDMKQEIKKMEELIQEELGMVKTYPEKPAYYLQVNKTGCRLLVRVNDIPLGYHFVKNEGQSMLYPINDLLLGSGKHTVSIQVYPRTGETEVTKDAGVNIKVVHYKEKLVGMPETLVELDTPTDIGMKTIPLYTDSISFNATLPFNHKKILAEATDLRTIPDLEEKVLAHYNRVRQMMIDGNCYEYRKMRLASTWVLTEMNYLGKEALEKTYIDSDDFFRFLEVVSKRWHNLFYILSSAIFSFGYATFSSCIWQQVAIFQLYRVINSPINIYLATVMSPFPSFISLAHIFLI